MRCTQFPAAQYVGIRCRLEFSTLRVGVGADKGRVGGWDIEARVQHAEGAGPGLFLASRGE